MKSIAYIILTEKYLIQFFRDFQQLQQSSGLVVNTISKLLGKNRRHRLLVLLLERKLTDAAHASGAASCAAGAGGRG